MKFAAVVTVATALSENQRNAENLLKNVLLQGTDPPVGGGQFVIGTVVLAQDRSPMAPIDFHMEAALIQRRTKLFQPLLERFGRDMGAVTADERLAKPPRH